MLEAPGPLGREAGARLRMSASLQAGMRVHRIGIDVAPCERATSVGVANLTLGANDLVHGSRSVVLEFEDGPGSGSFSISFVPSIELSVGALVVLEVVRLETVSADGVVQAFVAGGP